MPTALLPCPLRSNRLSPGFAYDNFAGRSHHHGQRGAGSRSSEQIQKIAAVNLQSLTLLVFSFQLQTRGADLHRPMSPTASYKTPIVVTFLLEASFEGPTCTLIRRKRALGIRDYSIKSN